MEVVNEKSPEPTSSVSMTTTAFSNVLISTLDESGRSQPKYTFPVTLVAEYDPEVRRLISEKLFLNLWPFWVC